jgi:DNA-directed RNA polymerase subunit K/omega
MWHTYSLEIVNSSYIFTTHSKLITSGVSDCKPRSPFCMRMSASVLLYYGFGGFKRITRSKDSLFIFRNVTVAFVISSFPVFSKRLQPTMADFDRSIATTPNRFLSCNVIADRARELEENSPALLPPCGDEGSLDVAFREFAAGLLSSRFNLSKVSSEDSSNDPVPTSSQESPS